jgi:hypothetical protein
VSIENLGLMVVRVVMEFLQCELLPTLIGFRNNHGRESVTNTGTILGCPHNPNEQVI